jgi:excisionase family DNA binding protein
LSLVDNEAESDGLNPHHTPHSAEPRRSAAARNALLLTKREAADQLGISTYKLDQLIKEGELPCVRVGGLTRVEVAAIKEFIERNRVSGPRENRSPTTRAKQVRPIRRRSSRARRSE